jgi:beta-lactamase regulating signal transducer with metallopeptidase domain
MVLALFCLLSVGAVCACVTSHHGQALEQVVSSQAPVLAAAPVVAVWVLGLLALPLVLLVARRRGGGFGRASPAVLQRLLF